MALREATVADNALKIFVRIEASRLCHYLGQVETINGDDSLCYKSI